jgi:hypothetical protein
MSARSSRAPAQAGPFTSCAPSALRALRNSSRKRRECSRKSSFFMRSGRSVDAASCESIHSGRISRSYLVTISCIVDGSRIVIAKSSGQPIVSWVGSGRAIGWRALHAPITRPRLGERNPSIYLAGLGHATLRAWATNSAPRRPPPNLWAPRFPVRRGGVWSAAACCRIPRFRRAGANLCRWE